MIRYKKLGYVELNVTDLERSRWFYEDMVGLGHGGTLPDGAGSLRCGTDPCRVLLHGAAAAGFKRVGWMLEDERQCDVLHRRLGDADVGWETVANAECRDRRLSRISRIA